MGETTTTEKKDWEVKIIANSCEEFADLERKIDLLKNHVSFDGDVKAEAWYVDGTVEVKLVMERSNWLQIHSPGHDGSQVDVDFETDCYDLAVYKITINQAMYRIFPDSSSGLTP